MLKCILFPFSLCLLVGSRGGSGRTDKPGTVDTRAFKPVDPDTAAYLLQRLFQTEWMVGGKVEAPLCRLSFDVKSVV